MIHTTWVPLPPADAAAMLPKLSPSLSQKWRSPTHKPNGSCGQKTGFGALMQIGLAAVGTGLYGAE
jgi:hypothetical protein